MALSMEEGEMDELQEARRFVDSALRVDRSPGERDVLAYAIGNKLALAMDHLLVYLEEAQQQASAGETTGSWPWYWWHSDHRWRWEQKGDKWVLFNDDSMPFGVCFDLEDDRRWLLSLLREINDLKKPDPPAPEPAKHEHAWVDGGVSSPFLAKHEYWWAGGGPELRCRDCSALRFIDGTVYIPEERP